MPAPAARSRLPLLALVLLLAAALVATCTRTDPDGALVEGPRQAPAATGTTTAPPPTTALAVPPTPPPSGPGALITPAGIVVPVVSRTDAGWTVTTPCNRAATLTDGTHVPAASIVLDAGHGGTDPGAVSPGGLAEKGINVLVQGHAKAALERAGVSVLVTRTADYDLELAVRAQIAKAVNARAFVSIHHNAEPDGPWPGPGSETYYQIGSSDSKRLAGLIYEEIVRALSRFSVAWVADRDAGAKYRPGRRGDYYAVLRQPAPVVSVLVEFAFISNPSEAELIAQAEVQRLEGEALARGIIRYLTTPDPGSGFVEPYPRPDPPGVGTPGTPPRCADPAF
ncbi:MAG: N-acetylmuramoyl-L-alanine amidase [Actinomycetota bacterium]|nr:N-acetylmuramoyl-L-alanine amidase [Actinomycetota bacterium]